MVKVTADVAALGRLVPGGPARGRARRSGGAGPPFCPPGHAKTGRGEDRPRWQVGDRLLDERIGVIRERRGRPGPAPGEVRVELADAVLAIGLATGVVSDVWRED